MKIRLPSHLALLLALASPSAALATTAKPSPNSFPLAIKAMRERSYPGSAITIEQTLRAGANYKRFVASYRSDGLKIYGLLTVPNGAAPKGGWPAIVFNHGYIPPQMYRTTERYVAYQDAFARAGLVTFKPDYRGNGNSQGEPTSAYFSPDYTTDVLNAFSSLRKYGGVNPDRVGMWGHSMGGNLTLRAMVIDPRIKAGVIWGGVVAPYDQLLSGWKRHGGTPPNPASRKKREEIIAQYGTPKSNPAFYRAISPNSFLKDLNGRPLELHHSVTDETVPLAFSQTLARELKAAGEPYTFYTYPGDNHDISHNLGLALARSVAFFKKNL